MLPAPVSVLRSYHPSLAHWYKTKSGPSFSPKGFALLERMFEYDPGRRCTAREALDSPFFTEADGVNLKCAPSSPPFASRAWHDH